MIKNLSLILFLFVVCISFVLGSTGVNSQIGSGYIGKISDSHFTSTVSPNFGKTFGTGNFRGAMPTPESIYILKKDYGVKTIISLIPISQMSKSLQKTIKDSGLKWIIIPLTDHPPKKSDRQKILTVLKSGHTFVHCKHGADRTGAIIARAWVELLGKKPDAAYKDMLTYNAKVEKIAKYKTAFKYFKKFIYYGYK